MKRRKQAGDTIVEVLIASAVIGLVLTAAYAIVNRSVLSVQDAEEHSQALQYTQGQVELLRAYVTNLSSPPTANTFTGNECLLPPASGSGGSITVGSGAQLSSCPGATDPAAYAIRLTGPDPSSGVYTVTASWTSLIAGTNNVTMYYRP
ncbi:MAG TPA: prepilin-type N-terminal cleavage/methylation domain-containing protein [Candidatus Saccharimonadales bacterium]|nr:prepilin-type N-terminal cleavage/methylation domain-containing protein [Candidatus Saccharimonadales bacterium]